MSRLRDKKKKKDKIYGKDRVTGEIFNLYEEPQPSSFGHNGAKFGFTWHPKSKLGNFLQKTVKSAILKAIQIYPVSDFNDKQRELLELLNSAINVHITTGLERPGFRGKRKFMRKIAEIIVDCCENEPDSPDSKKIKWVYEACKKYDNNAYVFEDPRLYRLKKCFQGTRYEMVGDICLFLMKEDSYYRVRWIRMLQSIKPKIEEMEFDSEAFRIFKSAAMESWDFGLHPIEVENIRREKVRAYGSS